MTKLKCVQTDNPTNSYLKLLAYFFINILTAVCPWLKLGISIIARVHFEEFTLNGEINNNLPWNVLKRKHAPISVIHISTHLDSHITAFAFYKTIFWFTFRHDQIQISRDISSRGYKTLHKHRNGQHLSIQKLATCCASTTL